MAASPMGPDLLNSKLALERNRIKAQKGWEYSACDLLTMHTLKNTDIAR